MATPSPESPRLRLPRLHIITDRAVLGSPAFLEIAKKLMEAGGTSVAFQLRGHGLPGRILWELGRACAAQARRTGAVLVINDRLDVALALGSWAVQLGSRSFTVEEARSATGFRGRIGVSLHTVAEAVHARREGADFVLAGTVFESRSHPGRSPLGIAALADVAAVGVPVIAIGGIDPDHVTGVLDAGAHGVAVLGGIWRAGRPVDALRRYLRELE